jgi:cobalt-zinc-cadmium efflux system protein
MGRGHGHTHGHLRGGGGDGGAGVRRALTWALVLNGLFLVVEAGIGFWTGSLALLSDAAHMLSDVGALALALGAAHMARRGADSVRTFGLRRAETLGAFVNGIILVVACVVIFWEAGQRLAEGAPQVAALPVLIAGILGLAINLGSAWWLWRADRENLNVRGALVHMLADALGSVGAIVSAGFLHAGVAIADPLVSIFIGVMVLWGTWGLLRDSARVLLEFAPPGVPMDVVRTSLLSIEGVRGVHELHLWSLDGAEPLMSAHLVIDGQASAERVRGDAVARLEAQHIHHVTLQVEVEEPCAAASACSLVS